MGRLTPSRERPTSGKRYVAVVADTTPEGRIRPLAVLWEDGRRFDVDRVLDSRQAVSTRTGDAGIRFTIQVGRRVTYLWYENPRWFVEPRDSYMPE